MQVAAIKTSIVKPGEDLQAFLVKFLPKLEEKSFVIITSKILSFAQNQLVPVDPGQPEQKHELVRQEADMYLDPSTSKYDVMLTIKKSILAVNAGIDQSNANDHFVLWPKDLQAMTNQLWSFLREHFGVKNLGVIITDSKTMPLKWGVTGTAIASCGFEVLINQIGKPDLFGKKLEMTQVNLAEAVGIAAALEMGEAAESQPLAVVTEVKQPVAWQDRPPTEAELAALRIKPTDDVYAPVLMNAKWQKGGESI